MDEMAKVEQIEEESEMVLGLTEREADEDEVEVMVFLEKKLSNDATC
jgi:hypothetical protein